VESHPPIDIREVSTQKELDVHIDIQLGAYGVSPEVIDRLRPVRRTWLGSPGRRLYLAYAGVRKSPIWRVPARSQLTGTAGCNAPSFANASPTRPS